MPDKRNYRRFNFEGSISLRFESDPDKIIDGKLLDISFRGISIFLKENINVDTLLQSIVQFDSLGSLGLRLIGKGKVVNLRKHRLNAQDGFRIGLEFVEVDKEIVIESLNRLESEILAQRRKSNSS